MIELFEQDLKLNDRQSSKGNQLKWENNAIWYKADYTGYEGLSEFIISNLLKKSTLEESEYVLYECETIKYKSTIYSGVKSKNFLKEGWQIITLERLFKNFFGDSLYKAIYQIQNTSDRLDFLVEQFERMTGLKNFGVYISKLFTIDAMFLNEDRHTHNITVLMNENGEFAYCPTFDNGAALLSDTTLDYPITEDVFDLIRTVHSKTISRDFDEQLDVVEAKYGEHISFSFTKNDVRQLLDQVSEYSPDIKKRVERIIFRQMDKYTYLFK